MMKVSIVLAISYGYTNNALQQAWFVVHNMPEISKFHQICRASNNVTYVGKTPNNLYCKVSLWES